MIYMQNFGLNIFHLKLNYFIWMRATKSFSRSYFNKKLFFNYFFIVFFLYTFKKIYAMEVEVVPPLEQTLQKFWPRWEFVVWIVPLA